jgi:hypothetical protein
MKLFLKAIALAAKDANFNGNPRDELNRLIDVAESSGLVVWHDDFCFKSTFWDWGNRETGNINWGGYGSSYKPSNEKYFKFQYPGDTATLGQYGSTGKLVTRKGAKPLDAVKALVLPEADADGTMQALLAKAGANPVLVADKGLNADAIVDLLTKKKCNFLLTADDLPKGLTNGLDKAAEAKNYFFTLPVGRLRPLLEKPKRAPVATGSRGSKAPPAFANKDDAKAYTNLKKLLASQKFEEIDQAILLLPGLPGVCDRLLEGITLSPEPVQADPGDPGTWQNWQETHRDNPGAFADYLAALKAYRSSLDRTKVITAWTNDKKAWEAISSYDRPSRWGNSAGTLPCELKVLGESVRLAEVPKNDLFNSSEAKRYALFSVINAAPEDCSAAKAIREGLVALHWRDGKLPPLSNFKALRHLYLTNSQGVGFTGALSSIVHTWEPGSKRPDPMDLEWIHEIKTLRSIGLYFQNYSNEELDEFLKKASFPALEEINFEKYQDNSPPIPAGIKKVGIDDLWISHQRLPELLSMPHLSAGNVLIAKKNSEVYQHPDEPKFEPVKITSVKERGEALSPKELSALKKLLRDDSPETVMQGLKILHTATPATIDALLEKSAVTWGYNSEGELGGNSGARLSGPFFDSLKRNDLGEAVRINLLSLATPGCQPADEIRKALHTISLPPAIVPIDVGGFNGIRRLKITIDPSKRTDNWITGLEKLTMLQKLELQLSAGLHSSLEKVFPLGFTPPQNVTEMEISCSYCDVKVKPDFISVSPNLRKLKIAGCWPLDDIPLLKGMDHSKLEVLDLDYYTSRDKLPSEDLTGLASFVNLKFLSGSRFWLTSLKGVEVFKSLRSLELESESLEGISELAGVTAIEKLKLGDYSGNEIMIGDLAALPLLNSLDFGKHKVADPHSLLKFRPETSIKLKNLDSRKE